LYINQIKILLFGDGMLIIFCVEKSIRTSKYECYEPILNVVFRNDSIRSSESCSIKTIHYYEGSCPVMRILYFRNDLLELEKKITNLHTDIQNWALRNNTWTFTRFITYQEEFGDEPGTSPCITVLKSKGGIFKMMNGYSFTELQLLSLERCANFKDS
jgi:hypothetical protein